MGDTWRGVDELHGAVVLDGVDVGDEPEHGGERRELRVDGERRLLWAVDEERAVGVDAGERAEAPELAVGGGGEVELADGVADLCLREVSELGECVLGVRACKRTCTMRALPVAAKYWMQSSIARWMPSTKLSAFRPATACSFCAAACFCM